MEKTQRNRLDDLWSEYIRKRAFREVHGCQRCLHWKEDWHQLQAAHCFTRTNYTTRWSPLNGIGVCGACHLYLDSHYEEKIELFRKLIGQQQFQALHTLAHMTCKTSPPDYKLIELYLKTLIQQLDGVVATTRG